jgi:hypothetical protein
VSAGGLRAGLKEAARAFREAYGRLMDFLVGAEYGASDVRASLQELKESIISIQDSAT